MNCFSCNHQVNVKTEDPLSAGVRVYVFGNLSTRPFKLDDGRVRQRVIVKSKYFRLRGHADNNDHNSVVLLATICSEIRHTEKYTLFTLLSTHIPKYVVKWFYLNQRNLQIFFKINQLKVVFYLRFYRSEVVKEEFHRIIVYDQSIIDVVRNSIQKFDRVHVEGKIAYMRYQNAGKTLHGGFIVANHIHKVN